jgi:hypothetical protein
MKKLIESVGARIHISIAFLVHGILILGLSACSSFPTPKFKAYSFPNDVAFIGNVDRPYQQMGNVRTKVNYQSLDPAREEAELCQNYFNKAVRDMVKMAKAKGADAVIQVKSVVFYEGGQHESYPRPECSDDGMEGQVLTEGIAIKWKNKAEVSKPYKSGS